MEFVCFLCHRNISYERYHDPSIVPSKMRIETREQFMGTSSMILFSYTNKMKPLRKVMFRALATVSSSDASSPVPSHSASTNVIPAVQIPSEQSAFVPFVGCSRGKKRDVVEALILLRVPVHSRESEAL
jgi:hypothetical protein